LFSSRKFRKFWKNSESTPSLSIAIPKERQGEGEQLARSKPRMQPNPLVNHASASKTAITCGSIRHFQAQQVAASLLLTGAHSSFIS